MNMNDIIKKYLTEADAETSGPEKISMKPGRYYELKPGSRSGWLAGDRTIKHIVKNDGKNSKRNMFDGYYAIDWASSGSSTQTTGFLKSDVEREVTKADFLKQVEEIRKKIGEPKPSSDTSKLLKSYPGQIKKNVSEYESIMAEIESGLNDIAAAIKAKKWMDASNAANSLMSTRWSYLGLLGIQNQIKEIKDFDKHPSVRFAKK